MKKLLLWCVVSIIISIGFISCSSSDSDNPAASGQNGNGTVALYVADGPTDEYEHIWIWIQKISLIPSNSAGEEQVTLFEDSSAEGYKIDLLEWKDQDFLLTLNDSVPAGEYNKIRMEINDIKPEGGTGECSDLEVKLPSGKIDLVPDQKIEVGSGASLSIRLDIDANKSIGLHAAGKSGKCIFRPVVFVTVQSDLDSDACPEVLTGTIKEFMYGDEDEIQGFLLNLENNRSELNVQFDSSVKILDSTGQPIESADLKVDQVVTVRGTLNDSNGKFDADLIVAGGVELLRGVVESSTDGSFILRLDNSAGDINVTLFDQSLLVENCNDSFTGSTVPVGASAMVYGKFQSNNSTNTFKAFVVMIRSHSDEATLTGMATAEEGYNLTLTESDNQTVSAFLPTSATIQLEGDITLTAAQLKAWVDCAARKVNVVFDAEASTPSTISQLIVIPDKVETTVTSVDAAASRITTQDGVFFMEANAALYKLENGSQNPITLQDVQVGDSISIFGVAACAGNASGIDYHGFIGIVTSAE